jgi:hypothetical protein
MMDPAGHPRPDRLLEQSPLVLEALMPTWVVGDDSDLLVRQDLVASWVHGSSIPQGGLARGQSGPRNRGFLGYPGISRSSIARLFLWNGGFACALIPGMEAQR